MAGELLAGEHCRWCGRDLGRFCLTRLTAGIEKAGVLFYPALCLCGGITVIGAGAFISHIDDFAERTGTARQRGRRQRE